MKKLFVVFLLLFICSCSNVYPKHEIKFSYFVAPNHVNAVISKLELIGIDSDIPEMSIEMGECLYPGRVKITVIYKGPRANVILAVIKLQREVL